MQPLFQTAKLYSSGRFRGPIKVPKVNIGIRLCFVPAEVSISQGEENWIFTRFLTAFSCISLCDCFVTCKDIVVYHVHFSGLIDDDKISCMYPVPKRHAKSIHSVLPQIEWLCLYVEAMHQKKRIEKSKFVEKFNNFEIWKQYAPQLFSMPL